MRNLTFVIWVLGWAVVLWLFIPMIPPSSSSEVNFFEGVLGPWALIWVVIGFFFMKKGQKKNKNKKTKEAKHAN